MQLPDSDDLLFLSTFRRKERAISLPSDRAKARCIDPDGKPNLRTTEALAQSHFNPTRNGANLAKTGGAVVSHT